MRAASPRLLTPRESAVEEKLRALRADPTSRKELEARVSSISRERAQKVRWIPIEGASRPCTASSGARNVRPAPMSVPERPMTASTLQSPARTSRSAASTTGHVQDEPVGGWKAFQAFTPPLRYGFESEGARRQELRRATTPLATSGPQDEPLLKTASLRTGPEVELIHSNLPVTLRPPSRGQHVGLTWQPVSREPSWKPCIVKPPPPTLTIDPLAPDEATTTLRVAARAARPPSPRMSSLQQLTARKVMSTRAVARIAEARNRLIIDQFDLEALSEREIRAQRSVISTQIRSARGGAHRYLAKKS